MDFDDWKQACVVAAEELGLVGYDDMWDEDDPYEVQAAAREAYGDGKSSFAPKAFVRKAFAEDLDIARNDGELAAEAEQYDLDDFE